MLKKGDKVSVTDYGEEKSATVEENNQSGIVWVRMEGTGKLRWFHSASLRVKIKEKE